MQTLFRTTVRVLFLALTFAPAFTWAQSATVPPEVSQAFFSETPQWVKSTPGRKLAQHGPNCWGTTLSLQGITSRPRFAWPEEILYWTQSPYCQIVPTHSPLQRGDWIHVYGPEYLFAEEENLKVLQTLGIEEDPGFQFVQTLAPETLGPRPKPTDRGYTGYQKLFHSVTVVNPQWVFGKDSPNRDDRFYFHRLSEVYARPGGKNSCQENSEVTPLLRNAATRSIDPNQRKCQYLSQAHRCDFKRANLQTSPELTELQTIETAGFRSILQTQSPAKGATVKLQLKRAHELRKLALDQLASRGVGMIYDSFEMQWTQVYFTASAILKTYALKFEK